MIICTEMETANEHVGPENKHRVFPPSLSSSRPFAPTPKNTDEQDGPLQAEYKKEYGKGLIGCEEMDGGRGWMDVWMDDLVMEGGERWRDLMMGGNPSARRTELSIPLLLL